MTNREITEGSATFIERGTTPFGAVREIKPGGRAEIIVYVENSGDFVVPMAAVQDVHFDKVILKLKSLDARLRQAIGHAHDAEDA